MTQHVIRIDNEVWNCLEEKARDLGMVFKSRNAVLRSILGLPPKEVPAKERRRGRARAAKKPIPRTPTGRPATIRR